jgi:uncharacterized DUF497 family protein
MDIKWDESKAEANRVKHGISFDEATTVFDDPLFVDFYDPDHSGGNIATLSSVNRNRNVCWSFLIQNEEILSA